MTYESLLKLEKIVRDMGWISELVQEKVDEMRGLVVDSIVFSLFI